MSGILLFVLGLVLGCVVSPWLFLLCVIPLFATAKYGRRGRR